MLSRARRPSSRWTAIVTAVATATFHTSPGRAITSSASTITARISRIPAGIQRPSACTKRDFRSGLSTANGSARRAKVMRPPIATAAMR